MRVVWLRLYRLAAWASATYLLRGERGGCAYARAGVGTGTLVPGVSDIDLVLVCEGDDGAPGAAAKRIHSRYRRAVAAVRPLGLLLDHPQALERAELADLLTENTLTIGARAGGARAIYVDAPERVDRIRVAERPGLFDSYNDWRHVRGRRLTLDRTARTPAEVRLAAWLELAYWWRTAFFACAGAFGPRGGYLAAKLIAEPARILLLLEHGETHHDRVATLSRAQELYPEESASLGYALELLQSAHRLPALRLNEVMPPLVRLSERIATAFDEATSTEGVTEVAVIGNGPADGSSPICDWRSLVFSHVGDERLTLSGAALTDPEAVGHAAVEEELAITAFRSCPLLAFPGATWERSRMRSVHVAATAPVTFALIEGRATAAFPLHPGLSLDDVSRRALAERRALLHASPESTVAVALHAARASLIRESVVEGEPRIPVSLAATAKLLAERDPSQRALVDETLASLDRTGGDEIAPTPLSELIRGLPGLS